MRRCWEGRKEAKSSGDDDAVPSAAGVCKPDRLTNHRPVCLQRMRGDHLSSLLRSWQLIWGVGGHEKEVRASKYAQKQSSEDYFRFDRLDATCGAHPGATSWGCNAIIARSALRG